MAFGAKVGGIGPVNWQQGGNPYRVVLKEQRVDHNGAPTLDELREALVSAGTVLDGALDRRAGVRSHFMNKWTAGTSPTSS